MIDTLSISKSLQEAGDTQEYAETLAGIFRTVFQENAVTKDDICEAFAGLDRKIDDKFGIFGRKLDEKFGIFDRKITGHALNLFFGLSGVTIATVGVAAIVLVTHLK